MTKQSKSPLSTQSGYPPQIHISGPREILMTSWLQSEKKARALLAELEASGDSDKADIVRRRLVEIESRNRNARLARAATKFIQTH